MSLHSNQKQIVEQSHKIKLMLTKNHVLKHFSWNRTTLAFTYSTVKSKQETFPAKNSPLLFDWLRSWIEAAYWSMVSKFELFAGFLYWDSCTIQSELKKLMNLFNLDHLQPVQSIISSYKNGYIYSLCLG